MLTSFLVLAHMVKLGVTHTHIWAYRKLKGAEERINFIYIYSWKLDLKEVSTKFWSITRRYNLPARSTYLR